MCVLVKHGLLILSLAIFVGRTAYAAEHSKFELVVLELSTATRAGNDIVEASWEISSQSYPLAER